MAKKKHTGNEAKGSPKVPLAYKPDNMTLEQWQIALRKQAAAKETFAISEYHMQDYPGYLVEVSMAEGNRTFYGFDHAGCRRWTPQAQGAIQGGCVLQDSVLQQHGE